jgi:hypothetical protein
VQSKRHEISIGTPLLPVFLIGFNEGPRISTETSESKFSAYPPLNVSYKVSIRKQRRMKTGITWGMVPEHYINYYKKSDNNFYLLVNAGIERGSKDNKMEISYCYDICGGYLQLPGYYFDGVVETNNLKAVIIGLDLGVAVRLNISKFFYLESETYLAYCLSYNYGDIIFWNKGSSMSTQDKTKYFWREQLFFSKLFGMNLGYKF